MKLRLRIYKFDEFVLCHNSEERSGEPPRRRVTLSLRDQNEAKRLGWGNFQTLLRTTEKAFNCYGRLLRKKFPRPLVVVLRDRQRVVIHPSEIRRLHSILSELWSLRALGKVHF